MRCQERFPALQSPTYRAMDRTIHFAVYEVTKKDVAQLRIFLLVGPIIGDYVGRSQDEHATLFPDNVCGFPRGGDWKIDRVGGRPGR